ncbi:MAG: LytR C-terminal domain-containing protein [Corynebacterium sp.]|nr:LytR C-terminal domain-containing protein [Corynebacterium sp.]
MNNNQQIPLRGLAMILIAVAIALGFWVAVSVIRDHGGSTSTNSAPAVTTSSVAATTASSAVSNSTAPESSSAPASSSVAPASQPINVLNNSMVSGLANRVGDIVRGAGFSLGTVGNYSESNFPNSVVLYPANDPAAQAEAERVAQALNIPAQVIPEGVNVTGITVITTSDLDR